MFILMCNDFLIHTSIYGNSQLNVFKNIKFLCEIFNNSPNDLLGTNLNKTLKSCF